MHRGIWKNIISNLPIFNTAQHRPSCHETRSINNLLRSNFSIDFDYASHLISTIHDRDVTIITYLYSCDKFDNSCEFKNTSLGFYNVTYMNFNKGLHLNLKYIVTIYWEKVIDEDTVFYNAIDNNK